MRNKNYLAVSILCLFALLLTCAFSSAQENTAQVGVLNKAEFNRATHFDVSPPLRELLKQQSTSGVFGYHAASPPLRPKLQKQLGFAATRQVEGLTQTSQQTLPPVAATVGANVLGVGVGFHGYTVPDAPTDSNLAVGDTQVVEWVNVSYAVFNKADGSYLAGPILGNTLWSGFNGSCSSNNSGDIIAQFDKAAHRWVLFQPVFSFPYASCFAISTTPDALGTYYRFQFPQNAGFPDYPKLGIMPDAYYQANNMFNNALTAYIGAQPCAYNRVKMLAGDQTAEQVCTLDDSNGTLFDDSMLPVDFDNPNDVPLSTPVPGVFVGSIDNHSSETNIYEYTYKPDFVHGTAVLTGVDGSMPIATGLPAFVGLCNFGTTACVPQSGTTSKLDSLGDRLMYRLALRRTTNAANVPTNHFLVSHAIANGTTGAKRWYEFTSPANNFTALTTHQGGTYAPDATYRFMGSLAMDKVGDIAMGYSRSSSTIHPDIYFTGRVPSDALGSMEAEAPIVNQTVATGSQSDTSSRWGDYTSMAIDNDGCTFWYVNQYYTTTTRFAWSTRVASLKFNACH
jgi:hypothetical protein